MTGSVYGQLDAQGAWPVPSDAMRLFRLERPVLHMSKMVPDPTGDGSGNPGLAAMIHVLSVGHPDV